MTKDEALKLALDALEESTDTERTYESFERGDIAITAIKDVLAQPSDSVEQEPLAWVTQSGTLAQVGMTNLKTGLTYGWKPLYTAPPKREWVRLTDEDMEWCYDKQRQTYNRHKMSVRGQMVTEADDPTMHLVWAVEAKLKELNHD